LDQLLSDKPLARRMGEHGLELVNKNYDFDGYIAGLESLFQRVISERETAALRELTVV
jgi:hypothetical protein